MKRRVKRVLRRVSPRFGDDPDWTISLLRGASPFALSPPDGFTPPLLHRSDLPGRRAAFVADPFGVRQDGRWYLFYEVLDRWRQRGHIEVSTSDDLRRWDHLGPVLREPFHLSYPQVIRHGADIYLVPEAQQSGAVRLYRASSFPTGWEHVADLLSGPVLLDATLFRSDGRWWMFADTSPTRRAGQLRLFGAPDLLGPWREHPASPVVRDDARIARPAGPVVRADGSLIRLAQDCVHRYGDAVHALRIDALSDRHYRETEIAAPLLAGVGHGWNATSMHHADLHRDTDGSWLAFVDGHASS